MAEPLIILGASARAAAQSAARGGFAPHAADLFRDLDLSDACPAAQVCDFPAGLAAAARNFPAGPWMYTGGLENHPALVDRLASERPLLGNSGSVLRQVRSPFLVAAALAESGLDHLAASSTPLAGAPCLRKPLDSCGGARIEVVSGAEQTPAGGAWYYQEYAEGASTSAVYLADGRSAALLGVTRQLVGESWAGAARFRYCGSLGPLALSAERRAPYERLGDCLARRFALRGLFGIDAIENEAGIWPVEVNPRYTASVEILERAANESFVALHVAAARAAARAAASDGPSPVKLPNERAAEKCFGKAVVYARQEVTIGGQFLEFVSAASAGPTWPALADIPPAGTRIPAGQPVVSIFAQEASPDQALLALKRRAAEVHALLAAGEV